MAYEALIKSQSFYTTMPQVCPYLPDQMERKIITLLEASNAEYLHNRLSQIGFRRSHSIAYLPLCIGCKACVPIRIPVQTFLPTRTQKRIFKRNKDVQVNEVGLNATNEQYLLFKQYLNIRHPSGEMTEMDYEEYEAMITNTPITTFLLEFRLNSKKLIAVSLVDCIENGLSAVYTFYDPQYNNRSLGCFSILYLIEKAKFFNLPYLYLGYWIKASRQMAYKSQYKPAEIYIDSQWKLLDQN
ncbi:MAG: arginyltransferase [Commensalibacter sp.]